MERRKDEEWGVETWKPQRIKKPGGDALERAMGGRTVGGMSIPGSGTGESLLPSKVSQPQTLQLKEPEYGIEGRKIRGEPAVSYAAGRENKKPAPTPSYAAGLQPAEPSWAELSGIKSPDTPPPRTPANRAPKAMQTGSGWKDRAWKSGKAASTPEKYGPKLSTKTQAPAETGGGKFRRYTRRPEVWELRDPAQVQYELEGLEEQYRALYQDALDTLDRAEWSEDRDGTMVEAARKYKDAFALSPQISDLKKELKEIEEAQRRYLMEAEGYRDATPWDLTVGAFRQGYETAEFGKEGYREMMGDQDSQRAEREKSLAGEEYKFVPQNWWQKGISGLSSWGGEMMSKTADPLTLGMMGAYGGAAAVYGSEIPFPEEALTVPAALLAGHEIGTSAVDMKIQAGLAYNELLKNGVNKDTAKDIACAIGGVNGLLGVIPIGVLEDSFQALKNSSTSTTVRLAIANELRRRGINVAWNTAQDVAQEGITIAGVQAGTKMDTGQWAYSGEEVAKRLRDTAIESALTNGLLEVPGALKNVGTEISQRSPHEGKGWISDQMAKNWLGDFSMIDFLHRWGDLSITRDMDLDQRITAVKNAVAAVLEKKKGRPRNGSG